MKRLNGTVSAPKQPQTPEPENVDMKDEEPKECPKTIYDADVYKYIIDQCAKDFEIIKPYILYVKETESVKPLPSSLPTNMEIIS